MKTYNTVICTLRRSVLLLSSTMTYLFVIIILYDSLRKYDIIIQGD